MKNKFLISFFIFFLHLNIFANEKTLTFLEAYNLSLKNYNKIKALDYQLEAGYENIIQAKSKLYPEVNFYTSYSKNEYKFNNNFLDKTKQKVRNYNVILHQPIFDKTIDTQIDIENYKYKSLDAEIKSIKQDLAKDILKLYLSLIESKNKIKMFLNYKENLNYKIELLEKQYSMDLSTQTEVLDLQIELNQVNVDLEKEKFLYQVNKNKLQIFMDNETNFRVPNLDNIDFISKSLEKLNKFMNSKKEIYSNFQIKKLENIVQLYKHEIKSNQYNHLPKVELQLKYTKNMSIENPYNFDSSLDEDKEIALSLVIPIFKGGYFDSRITASKLNAKASQEELNNLANDLKSQYKELETTLIWTVKSINLFKKSLQTAILSEESIKQEYKYGIKSIIDLYDAKYEIFKIKEKFINTIFTLVDTYLSLLILTNNFEMEDLQLIDLILED